MRRLHTHHLFEAWGRAGTWLTTLEGSHRDSSCGVQAPRIPGHPDIGGQGTQAEPAVYCFEGAGNFGLGAEEPILEKPISQPPTNPPSSEEPPDDWVGTFKATTPTETAPLPQLPVNPSHYSRPWEAGQEQAEALVLEGESRWS